MAMPSLRRGQRAGIVARAARAPFVGAWIVLAVTLGCGAAGAQTVSPPSLTIGSGSPVCSVSSTVTRVCVQRPAVSKIDFFGLFDDTTSFEPIVPTLAGVFTLLVPELEAAFPGVDFGFGVGRFEDYGGPGFGFGGESMNGRPFTLNQPIVTTAAAGSAEARNALITDALARSAPGNGGDAPEAALEGLYQLATGAGFDGNGDGLTTGTDQLQVAGSINAQVEPDTSGDVPAFSSLASGVPRAGTIGGAGFRSDAVRLVVLATDVCPIAAFQPGGAIPTMLQGNGSTVPIEQFACSSTDPGDDRFGFTSAVKSKGTNDPTVAPAGAAQVPAVVDALNAAGIHVIGVFPSVQGTGGLPPGGVLGPSFSSAAFLTGLARLTGAVDPSGAPQVLGVEDTGPALRASVIDAIGTVALGPIDVRLVPSAVPAGVQVTLASNVATGVRPGDQACFDVTMAGSGQPQGAFTLDFQNGTTGAALGSLPVTVTCTAACGDGTVDAFLGEQCDAEAGNGAPGSCCDASCHLAAAGTVCREGGGACDVAAVCDGSSPTCPLTSPRADGALCDDADPATGLSACVANVCEGVEIGVAVQSELTAQDPVRIPVVLDVGDGLQQPTSVQIQAFVSCDDLPLLASCTTKACRQLDQQLAQLCPGSSGAATFARKPRAPAGFVPVTAKQTRKFKRSRRGQTTIALKLNKTGRRLLSRTSALPLEVHVRVQERRGTTLTALFALLLRH